jgi:hypothetical protein
MAPSNGEELAALGIADAESVTLANFYSVSQAL